jgi:endoglucanase
VGEFGVLAAADRGSRLRWTAWVRHELDRLEIPWAYWDLATEFGTYDLERGAWDAELLDVLLGQRLHDRGCQLTDPAGLLIGLH